MSKLLYSLLHRRFSLPLRPKILSQLPPPPVGCLSVTCKICGTLVEYRTRCTACGAPKSSCI